MKRRTFATLLCAAAACGLLAGCSPSPETAATPTPSPTAVVTPTPVPTPEPTSEPTSEPTPTPTPGPASLREVFGREVSIQVDGQLFSGLIQDGTVYLNAAELEELWSWLQGQGDETSWTFTGQAPTTETEEPPRLDCVSPEGADGVSGVFFQGQAGEYWLPAQWLSEQFPVKYLWDEEREQAFLTRVPQADMAALEGLRIPIFMYHAVSDNTWGLEELFVSPSSLRAQLEYLTENGYDPIFFSDLSHIEYYDKPVILTFDDGYRDNYTELFPLLQEFQVKATCFVITSAMGGDLYITAEMAREMADSGLVDIQSHTVNHLELGALGEKRQEREIANSVLDLARATGRVPYVLSYPNGSCNDTTKALGAQYYDFGILKNGGAWYPDGDRFGVTRYRVNRSTGLKAFIKMVG